MASACTIDFLAPAREGDTLVAGAGAQRERADRVYDVEVHNQRGERVALFRGKSHRTKWPRRRGDSAS